VATDPPFPSDLLDRLDSRLDTVARHLAYLDRRFDDTNRRLGSTEHTIVVLLDDLGAQVDGAVDRSLRRQVTALACAVLGQLVVLAALMAGLYWWP
jgi:hypothetical protein